MKIFFLNIMFLGFLTLNSAGVQELSNSEISLLQVGQYHGKEVSAQSGELWFGLYQTEKGYELIPSRISIESINDAIVDDKDQKTGKKVSVDEPSEPLFLVKGLKNLKSGLVKTVFSGKKFLYPAESISFKLGGKNYYNLTAFGEVKDREGGKPFEIIISNYSIKISRSPWEYSQVLVSFDLLAMDGIPTLLWAGDLDGDGKLDLLMDLTNHYNLTVYTLFLSSLSEGNNLLKKAAEFRTTGC